MKIGKKAVAVVVMLVLACGLTIPKGVKYSIETRRDGENIVEFTDFYYDKDGNLKDYDLTITDGRDMWESSREILYLLFDTEKSSSWENVYKGV